MLAFFDFGKDGIHYDFFLGFSLGTLFSMCVIQKVTADIT
jgi:hypothetical protein